MDNETVAIQRIRGANELALAQAHIRFPSVLALEQQAPEWLLRLSTPAGVADFERRHGFRLPDALREYYRSLRLISLLQAAWDICNIDVFLTECPNPPAVETWHDKPHVVIGEFPYCDTVCGAELTGSDQYMYWEGVWQDQQPVITLSDWLHGSAVRLLGNSGGP
jgi:hypothetical protein